MSAKNLVPTDAEEHIFAIILHYDLEPAEILKKKIFLFHHKGALNLFFQCFVCPTQCENFRVFLNTIQILGEMNFKSDIFTKIYIQSLKNIVKMAVFNFQKLAKIDFT